MNDNIIAERRLKQFQKKFGQAGAAMLDFACHASLPVVLNPEFVHLLRINFFYPHAYITHTAEADLLLSSLCRDIGEDLYEIEPSIREALLQKLYNQNPQRIKEIATLLKQYTEHEHFAPWRNQDRLHNAQLLTALNFLDSQKAADWLQKTSPEILSSEEESPFQEDREWFIAMKDRIEVDKQAVTPIESGYELGLRRLEEFVAQEDLQTRNEFDLYQTRLRYHLDEETIFGSTEKTRAEINRIIAQLNILVRRFTGESFADLCVRNPVTSQLFTKGHALIIGTGGDLPVTINDAQSLAAILKNQEYCAYPHQQVHLLVDKQAHRKAILTALDDLAQATNHESTVLIYFSGHGQKNEKIFYLMFYGYGVHNLDSTTISGVEFVDKIRKIPAKNKVILLDCAAAGSIFRSIPLHEIENYIVIASSTKDERSLVGKHYSVFTEALIEALCGMGVTQKDGYVRILGLAGHIREQVQKRTQNKQHPIFHVAQGNNFVIAYYAGGDTQPKEMPFFLQYEREVPLNSIPSQPNVEFGSEPSNWQNTFQVELSEQFTTKLGNKVPLKIIVRLSIPDLSKVDKYPDKDIKHEIRDTIRNITEGILIQIELYHFYMHFGFDPDGKETVMATLENSIRKQLIEKFAATIESITPQMIKEDDAVIRRLDKLMSQFGDLDFQVEPISGGEPVHFKVTFRVEGIYDSREAWDNFIKRDFGIAEITKAIQEYLISNLHLLPQKELQYKDSEHKERLFKVMEENVQAYAQKYFGLAITLIHIQREKTQFEKEKNQVTVLEINE